MPHLFFLCAAGIAATLLPVTAFAAGPLDKLSTSDSPIVPLPIPEKPSAEVLQELLLHRAITFFWNESDPKTGLTKDRSRNLASAGPDTYTVASVASTGYALAALPVAVEHHWISRKTAEQRALTTLRWFRDKQPNVHGFYYHFVNWKTGAREWNCELSSIDSGLFFLGAITAGQYFGGETKKIADELYARADWKWMRDGIASNQPQEPKPLTLCMGWNPEKGFLEGRWMGYEDPYLYMLALGAPKYALGKESWIARNVKPGKFEGLDILGSPSPIFWAQMTPGYFNQRRMKDVQGYDWWKHYDNTNRGHVAFCARHPELYPNHLFGVNASDQPDGYGAEDPIDGKVKGTITPTGLVAGYLFVPDAAEKGMMSLWNNYREKAWGRYGFSNGINVSKEWYDPDVIGIDLGMMVTCLENHRSGLIWKLMDSHPMTKKAYDGAGFHSSR